MTEVNIPFSKNWNNKLNNDSYTTIRIFNPNKYKVGAQCHAILNGKYHHSATILDTRKIFFKDMNDWVTRLDANLPSEEFKDMMSKMYQDKVNGAMENIPFSWVLLKRNL